MKRIIALILAAALMAVLFTGCAAFGGYKGTEYEGEVTLADDSYNNLSVDLSSNDYTVSDEVVYEELNSYCEFLADLVEITEDRPVQMGDTANIDFVGYVDDVAFDGGTGTDYDLEIGSGTFIDDFEDQLIGAKKGDVVEVNVTFPENYGAEDLNGKDALFVVTINGIYEYNTPELTDELMQEMGYEGIDDAAAEIRASLESEAQTQKESDTNEALWAQVDAIAAVEIDAAAKQRYIDRFNEDYQNYAAENDMTLEELLSSQFGMTVEDFDQLLDEMADEEIRYYMIIQKLAKEMKIKIGKKDYEEGCQKLLEEMGYATEEEFSADNDGKTFEEAYGRETIVDALLAEAVMAQITANAQITY